MMQQCKNGHLYDDRKHEKCPYCCGSGESIDYDIITVDQLSNNESFFPMGIIPLKRISPDTEHPVLGWLIHLSEEHGKGKSIEIISESVSVGTHHNDDIRLSDILLPENPVSFIIAYDKKNKKFFIVQKDPFATKVYVNGEKIQNVTELCDLDIIQVGDMKLLFKPLCGNKFTWYDQDNETL